MANNKPEPDQRIQDPKIEKNKRGPAPGSQKAKHGGQAVREKYGPEFYAKIGRMGGKKVKEKRGPQFYAEIGKKGGESTKRQRGSEFYSRIGKRGGERGRATATVVEVENEQNALGIVPRFTQEETL